MLSTFSCCPRLLEPTTNLPLSAMRTLLSRVLFLWCLTCVLTPMVAGAPKKEPKEGPDKVPEKAPKKTVRRTECSNPSCNATEAELKFTSQSGKRCVKCYLAARRATEKDNRQTAQNPGGTPRVRTDNANRLSASNPGGTPPTTETLMKKLEYRAKNAKPPIEVKEGDREKIKAKFNNPCYYCGLPWDRLSTVDRRSGRGGIYSDADTVPCCTPCQKSKRNYGELDYIWQARRVTANWKRTHPGRPELENWVPRRALGYTGYGRAST